MLPKRGRIPPQRLLNTASEVSNDEESSSKSAKQRCKIVSSLILPAGKEFIKAEEGFRKREYGNTEEKLSPVKRIKMQSIPASSSSSCSCPAAGLLNKAEEKLSSETAVKTNLMELNMAIQNNWLEETRELKHGIKKLERKFDLFADAGDIGAFRGVENLERHIGYGEHVCTKTSNKIIAYMPKYSMKAMKLMVAAMLGRKNLKAHSVCGVKSNRTINKPNGATRQQGRRSSQIKSRPWKFSYTFGATRRALLTPKSPLLSSTSDIIWRST
ncbi:uncharacterized protein LOC117181839 [Belonocnema kinseyi]|uniref:uncharacterized protein LOC117181839 n=1 Tax=Belonocnema kinseyi TaxID=2817044 RepID=UPI00143CDF8F|nr:uncharacterized protein LOC117181839 [Belonocnema kinseyi]